ncbi:MAG: helix-hairpin-helix domain-containing protein, partial [Nocardioides sp.]
DSWDRNSWDGDAWDGDHPDLTEFDEAPPRNEPPADDESSAAADPWGATTLPAWLDTTEGRRTWAQRDDEAGHFTEVLEESESRDPDWEDDWDGPKRRFALLPPAAIVLIGIGVIACVVAGFTLLRRSEPVTPLVGFPVSAGPASKPSATPSSGVNAAPTELVVSVVGLVNRPGLVRLPPQARVALALERAGGVRDGADVLSLNLAQVLRDGDQILVGTREHGEASMRSAVVSSGATAPAGAGASGSAAAGGGAGGAVNLNTATAAELDALPGVGPVTAQAIVAWRDKNGGFSSVEQLGEVDGIGPARLAKLRDHVSVGP